MPQTHYIYLLRDPHSDNVRYVGCTQDPIQREAAHASGTAVESNAELEAWEKELAAKGLRPRFEVVTTINVPHSELGEQLARVIETYWIFIQCRCSELFNQKPGRSGNGHDPQGIVATRIRQFRQKAGYSVNYAAALAGLAQAEWWRFESGERLLTLPRLRAIADVLGCQPGAFIDD